jgi:hypothetical protein
MKRLGFLTLFQLMLGCLFAQGNVTIEKNLREEWMIYHDGKYILLNKENLDPSNTIYFNIDGTKFPQGHLSLQSDNPFFLFINGKLSGEHRGSNMLRLDSLSNIYTTTSFSIGIYQRGINERDLKTTIVSNRLRSRAQLENPAKPQTWFRDFVIIAGLIIIILFLFVSRLNPKLASDYFSINRIFSLREGDDSQSNVRLTSSTNIQFYVSCSLLLGFYMIIVIHYLPEEYALPIHFRMHSFWSAVWQWVRLSVIILGIFFMKILLIFSLTRLFSMRGVARIHFFNWVRVLLIVFGTSTIIVFIYFISRGHQPGFFVAFLSLVAGTLIAWIVLAFLKLQGKSEHSLFHLFSYICATEIIPLLITVKVLFQ